MVRKHKTRSEYILDALLKGNPLLLTDITKKVAVSSKKKTNIQDIASLLSKLSNARQSPIGHFIHREKTPAGYQYELVPEISALPPKEIYGLTRKTGKDRLSLDMAVEKIPELAKYIKKRKKSDIAGKKEKKKINSGSRRGSARKPLKPGRKLLPKPPEPVMVNVSTDDLVSTLMEQISRYGGPKLNVYLTITLQES